MQGISNSDIDIETGNEMTGDVNHIIGVLFPRAILLASLNDAGEVINAGHADCIAATAEWQVDFYERRFLNPGSFSETEKLGAIFIGTEKCLLVPQLLYEKETAENQLQQIHFIEKSENVIHTAVKESEAVYLFAIPYSIKELLNKYFPGVKLLPLPYYQFHSTYNTEVKLELCIADEQVFGTLYQNGKLQWHQAFGYQTAEDIAYQIGLLLQHHHIEPRVVHYNTVIVHEGLSQVMQELAAYYPGLKTRNGIEQIAPSQSAIHFIQQLSTCAL